MDKKDIKYIGIIGAVSVIGYFLYKYRDRLFGTVGGSGGQNQGNPPIPTKGTPNPTQQPSQTQQPQQQNITLTADDSELYCYTTKESTKVHYAITNPGNISSIILNVDGTEKNINISSSGTGSITIKFNKEGTHTVQMYSSDKSYTSNTVTINMIKLFDGINIKLDKTIITEGSRLPLTYTLVNLNNSVNISNDIRIPVKEYIQSQSGNTVYSIEGSIPIVSTGSINANTTTLTGGYSYKYYIKVNDSCTNSIKTSVVSFTVTKRNESPSPAPSSSSPTPTQSSSLPAPSEPHPTPVKPIPESDNCSEPACGIVK